MNFFPQIFENRYGNDSASIKVLNEILFPSKNGRGGVVDILGDCGSPDPGSIPGPGPTNSSLHIYAEKTAAIGIVGHL